MIDTRLKKISLFGVAFFSVFLFSGCGSQTKGVAHQQQTTTITQQQAQPTIQKPMMMQARVNTRTRAS